MTKGGCPRGQMKDKELLKDGAYNNRSGNITRDNRLVCHSLYRLLSQVSVFMCGCYDWKYSPYCRFG